MDLNDRQRKFAFAGVMVALTAAGVYLTLTGGGSGEGAQSPPRDVPTASATVVAPATPPPGIGGAVSPENFDIYRLLPFPQREFATAADVAQRFVAAYGTYRFDEDPQVYLQRLQPLVTGELLRTMARGEAAPGRIEQRREDQEVSEGAATIDEIRDIQAGSIVFVLTERQRLAKGGQSGDASHRFAVTVTRNGAAWRVYAFEPADVGQAGDTG